MSDKKIRIINPNRFMVGLKLMDGIREVVVHPNSFVFLEENDVYYINNMCRLFREKTLFIDDEEINDTLGYDKDYLTNEKIKHLLSKSPKDIKKVVEENNYKHIKDRIVNVAKDMDLPASKLRIIEEATGYDIEQILKSDKEKEEQIKKTPGRKKK